MQATEYQAHPAHTCTLSDDARVNPRPGVTRSENPDPAKLETLHASPAYLRGVARARAVMAGEADPFAMSSPALVRVERGGLVSERQYRRIRARRFAALDWRTGELADDTGTVHRCAERATVAELLAVVPAHAERVFLTGQRPHAESIDAFRSWVTEPAAGWTSRHYLERTTRPLMEWRHEDGRVVELLMAAAWIDDRATPLDVVTAMRRVAELVHDKWGDDATVLRSPATTGRDLWVRSIPRGEQHPVLPEAVQAEIRSTSTQGRIELLWQGGELPGLVEYDARVQYAALCTELPAGEPERWRGEHPHGEYARCRVRATWTVPGDWAHIGLLPVLEPGVGWSWPAEPGCSYEGWIAGVELALARRWGWTVTVHESLVWPQKGRPLDSWARRIADLALGAEHAGERHVRQALRAMILHAIGAFQGRDHVVTRSAPDTIAELPAGAASIRWEGDSIVWGELAGQAWPELAHPEWCAEVWARARVRLLDSPAPGGRRVGALHVPRSHLVGLYTDAIFLTVDPEWPDDGKVGRLRRELAHTGPVRAPRSIGELPTIRDEVVHG